MMNKIEECFEVFLEYYPLNSIFTKDDVRENNAVIYGDIIDGKPHNTWIIKEN